MANIDHLIDELFPGLAASKKVSNRTTQLTHASSRENYCDWDDSSSGHSEDADNAGKNTSKSTTSCVVTSQTHGKTSASLRPHTETARGSTHHFDEDDDDDDDDIHRHRTCTSSGSVKNLMHLAPNSSSKANVCRTQSASHNKTADDFSSDSLIDKDVADVRMSRHHLSLFAVPFPKLPELNAAPVCMSRCYLTNKAAELPGVKEPRPSVAELLRIVQGCHDKHSSAAEMMRRKGAYYVASMYLGNGAADHQGDGTSLSVGGCTWIMCLRCNYVVIRLQGAAWNDAGGATNLYLTTRNHYPDWSRFAASYPVGVREPQRHGLVLESSPDAAAYCCQCSWLTVRTARAVIEARITEAVQYRCADGASALFATTLPLLTGETRRPPLWVCRGHPCRGM